MSDAASSSAAKPGSRAALMQKQRAARELAEKHAEMLAKQEAERKALEEQLAAMNVGGQLDSTLERSLRANLAFAHGELLSELADNQDAIDLIEANPYGEEDLFDAEFWESGVTEPDELDEELAAAIRGGKGLSKAQAQQMNATYTKWVSAYRDLDVKFIARALLARELKIAFTKKREQVRYHMHCARKCCLLLGWLTLFDALPPFFDALFCQLKDARAQVVQSSASAAASEKKVERAVAMVIKTSSKKCGCETKCPASCGCVRSKLGCSEACGCKMDGCRNAHSYSDSPEDQEKYAAAVMAAGRLALKAKKGKAEEAQEAAIFAALEAGRMDH